MGLQIGNMTDIGNVREINEDSYLVLAQPNLPSNLSLLLAVADGMGGHQAGDVASWNVIATLNQLFSTGQFQQLVDYSPERSDYYIAVLKDVIEAINSHIVELSNQPNLRGMGTTATVALLSGHQLFVGHVGDSRGYLLRGGLLQQITQDHSWVADQIAKGKITPDEAYHHPKKNLLLRALGHSLSLRVDRIIQDVYPGDTIILCSDGLSNKVSDAEIAQIVSTQSNPQAACKQLVSIAKQRGGEDNITVIIARLDGKKTRHNLSGGRVFGPIKQINNQSDRKLMDTQKIFRKEIAENPALARTAAYTKKRKDKAKSNLSNSYFSEYKMLFFGLAILILATIAISIYISPFFSEQNSSDLMLTMVLGIVIILSFISGVIFGTLFPFDNKK